MFLGRDLTNREDGNERDTCGLNLISTVLESLSLAAGSLVGLCVGGVLEATSVSSGGGMCSLTLLLSMLSVCVGNVNDATLPSVCTVNVQGNVNYVIHPASICTSSIRVHDGM